MKHYESKQQLIDVIKSTFALYLAEFDSISEDGKDKLIAEVDKSPAQNLCYQLGWVNLLLDWEKTEKVGQEVIMPKNGFKWN